MKSSSSHLFAFSLLLVGIAHAEVLTVYPSNSTLEVGSTRQFTAYVPLTNAAIEWLVNDVVGGAAATGTISASGLYTPPATIPATNVVTVKARSIATPSAVGTTSLTLTRKYPWTWSTSPSSVSVGTFQISLNGANYASDSQVLINGSPVTTTYVSPTALKALSTAAAIGSLQVSVRNPGNGAIKGNAVSLSVTGVPVLVAVSPNVATVQLGNTQTFTSSVSGTSNTSVSWSIVSGGGSIGASTGAYTAPTTMPSSSSVTIRAISQASLSSGANATITLVAPPPPPITVTVSPTSARVQLGKTQTFTANVSNATNTAVSWSIVTGGGSINSSTGVYTAPANMPASSSVTIRATSQTSSSAIATASITITPPPPPTVNLSHARFLEQTSFGPTPATLAEVAQKGFDQYLADQFAMPATTIPMPADNSLGDLRTWWLVNATRAPDQLRQRVWFSLSQLLVVSADKDIYPSVMAPWMNLLKNECFGSYRQLLRDLTLCPSMGKYLDLAWSAKASIAGAPNENYARELMQLFSIGLYELNPDGSQKLDANNQPVPTYDQAGVVELARALTGWVYVNHAFEDFSGPMIPDQTRHDAGSKTVLGTTIPAGQTVDQDLDSVLDILMSHPNIAPFVCTRLIRSLVCSNPSPAYVQRVATVFNSTHGDLKAVITAIIMDSEARNDTPTATSGRLKDSILNICGFLRAMNGGFQPNHGLAYLFDSMAQSVLNQPSVFNWFSPLYRLPTDRSLFGPEFQTYSPSDCTLRGNVMYLMLTNPATDVTFDLTPFKPYGNDMPGLVEMANQTFLYGRMPAGMKAAIINAATPGYDATTRINTAIYLTILSGQYGVQF